MRRGFVAPNQDRLLSEAELESIRNLGTTCMRIWDYTPIEMVQQVLAVCPRTVFITRSSRNDLSDPDGLLGRYMLKVMELKNIGARVIMGPINEPNHHQSPYSSPGGMDVFRAEYSYILCQLQTNFPGIPTCSPNLAVMQADLEWAKGLKDIWAQHTYIGDNAYWQYDNELSSDWGLRVQQFRAVFPRKRHIILEVGDSTPDRQPTQKARAMRRNLLSMAGLKYVSHWCAFMLGGTPDWQEFYLSPSDWAIVGGNNA